MKLMFVENRYTTWLWREVAVRLQLDGHDIHWLVQNPAFSPGMGVCHVLAFPDASATSVQRVDQVPLLKSDRGVRFFGGSGAHHASYIEAIAALIDQIRPDIIFGEQTQFHELITVAHARKRNIPYLFPTATRYPPGRIAFHVYDTLETFGGCGEKLSRKDASSLRQRIIDRQLVPSYMVRAKSGRTARFSRLLADRIKITYGWVRGERFVTPSPWVKYKLDRAHQAAALRWEKFSHASLPAGLVGQPLVLYAMQMQPESNIDVWGNPWQDQAAIIQTAASALQELGAKLVVKPNPKSKYELDRRLCDIVESHPNIVPLAHAFPMAEVFPRACALLSVTGTVILEAIFSGKPVGVLGSHAMARYPGVTAINEPAEIAGLVSACLSGSAKSASAADAEALLRQLHCNSYVGTFYDPFNQPEYATSANLHCIADAFRNIIGQVSDTKLSRSDCVQ